MEYDMPLDPFNERYRKCPECGHEFMTDHLLRVYCCNYCHNHYNARKRRNALKESSGKTGDQQVSHPSAFDTNNYTNRDRNIRILEHYNIPPAGLMIDANELEAVGYDFSTYDHRLSMADVPSRYVMVLGKYQLQHYQSTTVLIYKYH